MSSASNLNNQKNDFGGDKNENDKENNKKNDAGSDKNTNNNENNKNNDDGSDITEKNNKNNDIGSDNEVLLVQLTLNLQRVEKTIADMQKFNLNDKKSQEIMQQKQLEVLELKKKIREVQNPMNKIDDKNDMNSKNKDNNNNDNGSDNSKKIIVIDDNDMIDDKKNSIIEIDDNENNINSSGYKEKEKETAVIDKNNKNELEIKKEMNNNINNPNFDKKLKKKNDVEKNIYIKTLQKAKKNGVMTKEKIIDEKEARNTKKKAKFALNVLDSEEQSIPKIKKTKKQRKQRKKRVDYTKPENRALLTFAYEYPEKANKSGIKKLLLADKDSENPVFDAGREPQLLWEHFNHILEKYSKMEEDEDEEQPQIKQENHIIDLEEDE